jgi:hypothetical protein
LPEVRCFVAKGPYPQPAAETDRGKHDAVDRPPNSRHQDGRTGQAGELAVMLDEREDAESKMSWVSALELGVPQQAHPNLSRGGEVGERVGYGLESAVPQPPTGIVADVTGCQLVAVRAGSPQQCQQGCPVRRIGREVGSHPVKPQPILNPLDLGLLLVGLPPSQPGAGGISLLLLCTLGGRVLGRQVLEGRICVDHLAWAIVAKILPGLQSMNDPLRPQSIPVPADRTEIVVAPAESPDACLGDSPERLLRKLLSPNRVGRLDKRYQPEEPPSRQPQPQAEQHAPHNPQPQCSS